MTQAIQVGAKGIVLKVQVIDENGTEVPVDGAILFHFESPGGTDYEVTGVIEDAAEGRVAYQFSDGDGVGETAGVWQYQVELDLSGGWAGRTTIETFEAVANL